MTTPVFTDRHFIQRDSIAALIFQIVRRQRALVDNAMEAFDITPQQGALLVLAAMQPEATPADLAPQAGTDNPGVTRLIDRLEEKGLVARRNHPSDRRSILLELTDDGRALLPKLRPVYGAVERRLATGFSGEELEQLKTLLRRLLKNMEAEVAN